MCIHCGREPANRPRGLGWNCYYKTGVRDRYPPTDGGRWARNGPGQRVRGLALPATPTAALPGTEAKMAVMAERVTRGEALFHPADLRWD